MTQTPPQDPQGGAPSGNAKPDPLLDRLAELAREERAAETQNLDPRWDAMAAGTLDDTAIAELRALAETSPEHARAWEAFQPLGEDFQRRVLAQITPEARSEEASTSAKAQEGGEVLAWRPAAERRQTPRPARRWIRAGWIPLAAAAAFAAFWLRPEAVAPLPEYDGRLSGVRAERSTTESPGEAAAATRLAPGSRLELVLAPATDVEGAIEVATWLWRDEALEPVELPHEVADSGAIRFSGQVGAEVDLPTGASTLVVAVARRGEPNSTRTLDAVSQWLETGQNAEGDGLRLLRFEIAVEPQPPPPPETDG